MNIEDIPIAELKTRLVAPTSRKANPVVLEKAIYAQIRGSVDEDTLLIEPTDNELEEAFTGVIEKVIPFLNQETDYKIFCFLHLNSKQGPRTQIPAISINIEETFQEFMSKYKLAIMELENRYIGGEEYQEQTLIMSRIINVQFQYQIWTKKNSKDKGF